MTTTATLADDPTEAKVRVFIAENFVLSAGGNAVDLRPDQSLRQLGIIDSTGVLELIAFLEETFEIAVKDEETIPENLDSVGRIVSFIARKRAEK